MIVRILAISFAFAFVLAAICGAETGAIALVLFAALVTLPVFLSSFLRLFLVNLAIAAVLGLLSVLFPPLGFLAIAWAALSLILKFARLARNLVPIAAGVILYSLLFMLPALAVSYVSGALARLVAAILFAGIGAGAFHLALLALRRIGFDPTIAASLMLGFPVYLTLFMVTLFLPGADDFAGGDAGDWC